MVSSDSSLTNAKLYIQNTWVCSGLCIMYWHSDYNSPSLITPHYLSKNYANLLRAIASSDFLSHHLSQRLRAVLSLSDHFSIFNKLSVNRTQPPPPTLHSFRRVHSINIDYFLWSAIISSHNKSFRSRCSDYYYFLDKHGPLIINLS